jgi:hypothetical protein
MDNHSVDNAHVLRHTCRLRLVSNDVDPHLLMT